MRTFLLMIGSAVCGIVLFVAAVYGYLWWQWSRADGVVSFPPPASEKKVDWSKRPIVTGTRFNLSEQKLPLKKGYYYAVEIEALGELQRVLSQSPRHFDTPDFRIID